MQYRDTIVIYENGKPMAAFRKSKIDSVCYGVGTGRHHLQHGCYVGVNGTSVFISDMDVETFYKDVIGLPIVPQLESVCFQDIHIPASSKHNEATSEDFRQSYVQSLNEMEQDFKEKTEQGEKAEVRRLLIALQKQVSELQKTVDASVK